MPGTDIPISDIEEWLALWEALAQYVENSDDADDDPKVAAARDAAKRVLDRMDEVFVLAMDRQHVSA